MLHLPAASREARAIGEIADLWARRAGPAYGAEHRWVDFLLAFDLDYRKRRLYFLIQGQNRLYGMLDEKEPGNAAAASAVDRLKREFYRCLDGLRHREAPGFFSDDVRARARSLFDGIVGPPSARSSSVTKPRSAR